MVERKKRFLRTYLVIAFAFGILGLTDSVLSLFKFSSTIYALIISLIAFVFFFFNIFSLVSFMQNRLEKITWVLPIYHMISYVLFFILGWIMATRSVTAYMLPFSLVGMLTSAFEILFSIYLLRRFEFF